MFVIDANGSDLARNLNRTRTNAHIIQGTDVEALFFSSIGPTTREIAQQGSFVRDDLADEPAVEIPWGLYARIGAKESGNARF